VTDKRRRQNSFEILPTLPIKLNAFVTQAKKDYKQREEEGKGNVTGINNNTSDVVISTIYKSDAVRLRLFRSHDILKPQRKEKILPIFLLGDNHRK